MNAPAPRQWTSDAMSAGFVADYKPFTFVDGPGVRCSLYVSGCPFRCAGCYNACAQNFRYGQPYSDALEQRILADLEKPYASGLSLLGGEPMLNTGTCLRLARAVRARFGASRDIWCWTGYTWEQLQGETEDKRALLREIDVLVDGPFVEALRDANSAFRGSSNQRLLDVGASLRAQRPVAYPPLAGAATRI